jgi:hypothetical protein
VAEAIVKGDADDVVAAKGNRETRRHHIRAAANAAHATAFHTFSPEQWDVDHVQEEGGHGWVKQQSSWTLMDPAILAAGHPDGRWRDLRAIGMVRATRTWHGKTTTTERYVIMSLDGNA